ncbi:hypothetical protein BUALT_Bualt12G0004900 [Buddleja alternifolia]|uniref:E3 ubiquitin-protein ligase RMA n=1 Tax=Buddleja alternifolia TaxID=168488 RepID=A0AAV6WSG1_9LAMI|nr:hypothetical protein BUALT_Bualt12G0004900 [Buddleja alternifolia]
MAEENSGTMNLDLNLGPNDDENGGGEHGSGSYPNVTMNLEDYLDGQVHRELIRHTSQRWRSIWTQVPIPPETRNLAMELISGNTQQTGEGSIVNNENSTGRDKTLENGSGFLKNEALDKKDDLGKNNIDEGSFFDCNICLDLAKDPVVTCCGHLFCWPCLYRWLHHHSDAKECPICKGEVTMKNVTPIYGRGNNNNRRDPELEYSSLKIPLRPQARRVESWRQAIQRSALNIPMEEMIRRLGSAFDLRREWAQIQSEGPQERSNSLLNRVLTSRGLREERRAPPSEPSDDVIQLPGLGPPTDEMREILRAEELLLRRRNDLQAETLSRLTSVMNSPGIDNSYFDGITDDEINEGLGLPYDDLDSLSSIAAVIHSESHTLDTGIEIDPSVYLSTLSSSRRRNDGSRISDVDTGDSRANRRRRLN